MSTSHKEKIIRVLQLFQTTDEKTPMNAVQISQKLEEEYGMENVHRTSIYDVCYKAAVPAAIQNIFWSKAAKSLP